MIKIVKIQTWIKKSDNKLFYKNIKNVFSFKKVHFHIKQCNSDSRSCWSNVTCFIWKTCEVK